MAYIYYVYKTISISWYGCRLWSYDNLTLLEKVLTKIYLTLRRIKNRKYLIKINRDLNKFK